MSSDEDDFEYDLYDPCSREHEDYKISQDNYADARRRYKYGNNVDLGGWNFEPWEEENKDSIETRLANAKEARAWAFDEAQRRYAWNEKWFGGRYQGVMQQADQRMREIERLNEDIEYMERRIGYAEWAAAGSSDGSHSSSDEGSYWEDSEDGYGGNSVNEAKVMEWRHVASEEGADQEMDSEDEDETDYDDYDSEGYDDYSDDYDDEDYDDYSDDYDDYSDDYDDEDYDDYSDDYD